MGIFKDEDASIDKQFATVLQAAEANLFSRFRRGYKSGLKLGYIFSRAGLIEENKNINPLERPFELGFMIGLCVEGIMNKTTYGNPPITAVVCDFIIFLKKIPGFNIDVLRKRAKRIDVKGFTPEEVKGLKIVLRVLS